MRYLKIEFGATPSNSSMPWWGKLLQKIIPAANPDLEHLYEETITWWLEVDENGEPQREIGFNKENEPIVLGPIGENYGLLVDTGKAWDNWEYEKPELKNEFEFIWNKIWKDFEHLNTKGVNKIS